MSAPRVIASATLRRIASGSFLPLGPSAREAEGRCGLQRDAAAGGDAGPGAHAVAGAGRLSDDALTLDEERVATVSMRPILLCHDYLPSRMDVFALSSARTRSASPDLWNSAPDQSGSSPVR